MKEILKNIGVAIKLPFIDINYKPSQEEIRIRLNSNFWQEAANGAIPEGAVVGGYEGDGAPLYIARVTCDDGSIHPGKVRSVFHAAYIPLGGQEVPFKHYQVFVGNCRWAKAADGKIPVGAIVAGCEADGTPLYVARAKYEDGLHIGKVRPSFGAANIPLGGKEIQINPYEVLVTE